MSWLFKSLQANDDDSSDQSQSNSSSFSSECVHNTAANPSVKDDLSVLGETLSRQLRGVANFLAPQPSPTVVDAVDSSDSSSYSPPASQTLLGIRNDLAEIGGSLRTGLSLLSVGEISRFASNLLPFQSHSADDEEYEEFEGESIDVTPGITDEVLNFVTEISSRPEYWTDFPLALEDTEFNMSDDQRMHISTVEQLIPNISALKIKLQSFMSNELFWMIYFIMLLPRMNQHDFELLSTPEIVEAREILLEKLQRKENPQLMYELTRANSLVSGTQEGNMPSGEKANSTQIIKGTEGLDIEDGENTNERLEKEDSVTSSDAKERLGIEEISFSDIEDDANNVSGRLSLTKPPRVSSPTESSDWVQLHENVDSKLGQQKTWKQDRDSEGGESSDWFNVDEFD